MAPAAFAAAAVGGGGDAVGLQAAQQGLPGGGGDGLLRAGDADGDLIAGRHLRGVVRFLLGAEILAKQLVADEFLPQAQALDLLVHEAVHGLRAAEEDGVVSVGRVLSDQLGGDEIVLTAVPLLVAEHVHQLEFRAGRLQRPEFLLEDGVVQRAAAVEEDQLGVLVAVHDGPGQGAEGRDAAAAGHADDGFRVPQRLIGKDAQRLRDGDRRAHAPVVQDVPGGKAAAHPLHGEHILPVQGLPGGGRQGVGPGQLFAVHVKADGQVLSRAEPGQGPGAPQGVRLQIVALHIRAPLHDLCHPQILHLGVQGGGDLVGLI